jgi:DNA-binding transcriptional MerR regulator/effector-binding domain-containing protein
VSAGLTLPLGQALTWSEVTTARNPTTRIAPVELGIGAFSRRSRLSPKALRLYDRLGLLTPASVDERNGYRRYREEQLETARLIALLRRLDMPLATVAEVLAAPESRRAELVSEYWAAVEHRIASQRELAAHLRLRLSGDERSFEMYDIHERDVPKQVVLTEQRHVRVPELQTWLPAAMDRLLAMAADRGGPSGPGFVVYHGEVSEDSDGPVEVCVPVAAVDGAAEVPVRTEPAHREAYTTITKAQVAYPQILSAYDAVAEWVQAEKRTVTGSPREVYFADFDAAAPTDEVCDIAFPVSAED